jgi:hypothetical protein
LPMRPPRVCKILHLDSWWEFPRPSTARVCNRWLMKLCPLWTLESVHILTLFIPMQVLWRSLLRRAARFALDAFIGFRNYNVDNCNTSAAVDVPSITPVSMPHPISMTFPRLWRRLWSKIMIA